MIDNCVWSMMWRQLFVQGALSLLVFKSYFYKLASLNVVNKKIIYYTSSFVSTVYISVHLPILFLIFLFLSLLFFNIASLYNFCHNFFSITLLLDFCHSFFSITLLADSSHLFFLMTLLVDFCLLFFSITLLDDFCQLLFSRKLWWIDIVSL